LKEKDEYFSYFPTVIYRMIITAVRSHTVFSVKNLKNRYVIKLSGIIRADAILVLKLLARLDVTVRIKADVNNDGKISVEEVVYIFQTVAGLRPSGT
jgi:hypothetical protein